jgi:hypothetical protein
MSYFIIDINTEFDINKIILGTPVIVNDELTKVYLYYLDNDTPKEIFLKVPPLRLIYSYKNLKFNQIKLPIYPIWSNTTKFIKLIKKIEKHIRVNINCDKGVFVNSIEKADNLTTLKMNITQNVKISSQIYTSLGDLKINGEIETITNISYIWIKKNSYGLSLSCYQIKYTPRVEEIDIDFFDNIKNQNNQNKELTLKNRELILQNKEITSQNKMSIVDTPAINIKPLMVLSSSMLNDAITKLNKVKN